MESHILGAEQVTLFCRLNMNIKRDLPVRASEMGLLIYLVKTNGPKTSIQIADFFKVTKANVAAMVHSLVKSGYIEKEASKYDKRSFNLIPTQKAITLVDETYHEYFKTMELLMNEMGLDDYMQLISLLKKANKILLEEKK